MSQLITATGKIRCRFDMFVVLREDQANRYPRNSLTWCHRGDKYAETPEGQIVSLVRMITRHHAKYKTMILYDNTKPKDDKERNVVKIHNGAIEENRLDQYKPMLRDMVLPDFLK